MQPHRAALACVLVMLAVPSQALADGAQTSMFPLATTDLLSRSEAGGIPNGPSRNPAISRDARTARIIAYESDAGDIAPGDSNGLTDIFLVRRAEPYGQNGTPWRSGGTELASRGMDGQPANGPSYRPALDGGAHSAPSCAAFVSDASNLVPGDTNGVADAFVRDLRSGQTTRVSVDTQSRQANGPSFEVAVDGDCGRVAFSSAASNLGLTRRTRRLGWGSVRTTGPPAGTRQVYVRMLATQGPERRLRGLTFLASASTSGRAGNGDSTQPAFAGNGKSLAFTSTATNLAPGDGSASPDVYQRTMVRKYRRFRAGHAHTLVLGTRLVSSTRAGRAGSGPSSHPAVTDDGRYVAYETDASDVAPGDDNGASDVVRADLAGSPARQLLASKTQRTPANGPSRRPVISGAGHSVLFDSDATNLKMFPTFADDANGVRDVFIGVIGHGSASRESLTAQNRPAVAPSENVATSTHNNYIAFESTDRTLDASVANPAGQREIYLRYLGPK